ncbi:hypothetical protein EJB05_43288 [Eragrostis curvula]|uniref:NAC domain-containing protein n=1 Tax=Eragrostis curvula TaxID=38414 RepID=A0A5J9TEU1_9POAL|nr:hypothetical protein EJB05_43288 [Eragrostis curvula]
MAEGDEKKSVAGAGGGGHDARKVKYPTGFRFKPTDEELIEYYLLPRLQGRPTEPNDAIIEANVYEFHPDTLINGIYKSKGKDEWFFLSPRARMYQNGVRPSRKTEDGRGRWKASTATKVVAKETVSDGVKFCKNVLNYFAGSPKDETRTKWLMRELTIPEFEIKRGNSGANATLDEYVMCKIYLSPVHKTNDDDASADSACVEAQSGQLTSGSKRRLEEQSRGFAAARKQARQGSLTIGRTQPSGPVPPTIYCLPAQPTGYNVQAPVQRPSGMHNGQAQQPGGSFNGQELMRRTPIPTQFQPNAATTNPNSFGRMPMMVRPPNMGFPGNPLRQDPGTGFRPQVSLRCHYDQNYGAVQPQGNAAHGMPQQRSMAFAPPPPPPQQHQFFNVNADDFAGAFSSSWPPYNGNPYKGSSMEQEAGDQALTAAPGASNAGSGMMRDGNMNAEHHFVELAAINTSLAGARPQTAAVSGVELATPKVEAEMEETNTHASSSHKQDTA